MRLSKTLLTICLLAAFLAASCSSEKKSDKPAGGSSPAVTTASKQAEPAKTTAEPPLPQSDRYYVLDKQQRIVFEIDLKTNSISRRFVADGGVVAIAYDMGRDWIYEATGKPRPGLDIFDPKAGKLVQRFEFIQPPSDILFHPIKRHLYIISEDSTYFRVFSPDSMKMLFSFPLEVIEHGFIGPRVISPGPAGKLITANGARGAVTEIFTDNNYMYQTITIKEAGFIDNAVFSFDGKSSFSCDAKSGKIFRVEFGSGRIMAKKEGLDNPRLIQIEVKSNTIVVAVGKNTVIMLNPDTFAETGKVDLSKYGDNILSMVIPPKANFAELLMDYKGVTRWLRFDVQNWEPMRLVELI
jgi:hypothetical protein